MATGYHSMYNGGNYPLSNSDSFSSGYGGSTSIGPDYGNPISHEVSASSIAMTTNAQTANQLKATYDALNTGAKGVEVQLTFAEVEKAIPNQHLDEINRLRKLTGAELTLHGPMIEPTGINPQQGNWDEQQRIQSERAIWNAVERGHKISPKGNLVVTLHSSHGLPDPRTKIITDDGNGNKKEVSTSLAVIDQRTGRFGSIPKPTKDELTGKEASVDQELKKLNSEQWGSTLTNLNIELGRGRDVLRSIDRSFREIKQTGALKNVDSTETLLKLSKKDGGNFLNDLPPQVKERTEDIIDDISTGSSYIKDSYRKFQEIYSQAHSALETNGNHADLKKVKQLRKEILPKLEQYEKDKSKIGELSKALQKGLAVLDSIEAPTVFKPLEDFAIDKASQTFANVAFNGYSKFKENAPVISIENPPAGSGLYRAEEIKELVLETQKKFQKRLMNEKHLSESEAKKQAEKLIGATWDVGHINMLRKYGYDTESLKKQAKTIAPYIKNIHLSDNFGMEHSELPMGMGNVPMKEYEKLFKQYGKKIDEIKRVVETGDWYQHFQSSPYGEVLSSFGSPMYAGASPGEGNWNQSYGMAAGGYSIGFGQALPDVNFQTYGAGFSNLPVELGGQMSGRNRLSGSPME